MENYVFKLLRDDGTILDVRSAALRDLRAVWSTIAELARQKDMTGGRIIVSNSSGEVLVLVGAATARSYPTSRPWPPQALERPKLWVPSRRAPIGAISTAT